MRLCSPCMLLHLVTILTCLAAAAASEPQQQLLGETSSGRTVTSLPPLGKNSGSQQTVSVGPGRLLSWGLREWRLGRNQGDNTVPEIALKDLQVMSIAASRHSALSTVEGHVWTMGHNDSKGGGGHGSPPLEAAGQLGRGGSREPGRVLGPLENNFVVQVATGRYHTVAVTHSGEVYTWGLNDWGQLGRPGVGAKDKSDPSECVQGPSCHDGAPKRVMALEGVRIVAASCGRYNTAVLDDKGRMHVFGFDGCGSDGKVPERDAAFKPRPVLGALANRTVVAFDSGYTFWIAATDDGKVYTCNHQDDGYAGTLKNKRKGNDAGELGRGGNPFVPMQVTGELHGKHARAVAAGREHGLVCTKDGQVYSWGGGRDVMGRTGSTTEPGLVKGELAADPCTLVAAGEYFSLAASKRYVYGWGGNNYHTAGVGRNKPSLREPTRAVGELEDGSWTILGIAAGFQHTLAIAVRDGKASRSKLSSGSSKGQRT